MDMRDYVRAFPASVPACSPWWQHCSFGYATGPGHKDKIFPKLRGPQTFLTSRKNNVAAHVHLFYPKHLATSPQSLRKTRGARLQEPALEAHRRRWIVGGSSGPRCTGQGCGGGPRGGAHRCGHRCLPQFSHEGQVFFIHPRFILS